jgi:hypothetical protein
VLITSEFLTDYRPPDLGADANFFVIARTEGFGADDDEGADPDANGGARGIGWIEDRTRVTDSSVLAVAWAILLSGVADDGANPLPLARVRTFAVDPQEHPQVDLDHLPGERIVLYVESDGTILDAGDDDFAALERQTGEWSEIVKIYSDDGEDDDDEE